MNLMPIREMKMNWRTRLRNIVFYRSYWLRGTFSRRFLILDFISGGKLMHEAYQLHSLLGRLYMNHVFLQYPFMRSIPYSTGEQRPQTDEEYHKRIAKNINTAKGILIKRLYQI